MAPYSNNQTSLLVQPSQKRVRRAHPNRRNPQNNPRVSANNPNNPIFYHVPYDVLEHIFSYLPIKNATQASVLSKRFRDSWIHNRKLIFDKNFFRRLSGRTQFVSIVNRIFNSHVGTDIQLLRLFIDPSDIEQHVIRWVLKAIEKNVQQLDLDFDLSIEPFDLPYKFLDVPTLRTLNLTYCRINKYPSFQIKGLSFLSTLVLRKVILDETTIDMLVYNCLNLETLDLADCYGVNELKIFVPKTHKRFKVLKVGYCFELLSTQIDAPALVSFHYVGSIQALEIYNNNRQSKLNDVILNLSSIRSGVIQSALVEKLIYHNLLNVTILTITSTFLEGVTSRVRDGVFGNFRFCLRNLKELQLFMDNTSYCNLGDIASFIDKCPRIEKLFIDMSESNFNCGAYWELHQGPFLESFPNFIHCLKFVKLRGFRFLKHEIEMVRYFLKRSLQLEYMVLVFPKNGNVDITPSDSSIFGRLFRTWKISPKAQIMVFEHWNDDSISPMHSRVWY